MNAVDEPLVVSKDQPTWRRSVATGAWWSTAGVRLVTGISDRRINYWRQQGVFGSDPAGGTGSRLLWAPKAVDVIRVLVDVAEVTSDVELLARVVRHFDEGSIPIGERALLTWETA